MSQRRPISYLLLSALIWGSSFPVIEFGLRSLYINFYLLFFLRYLLGAMGSIIVIILLRTKFAHFMALLKTRNVVLLGLLNMIAVTLGTLGQVFTVSGKAALLTNINLIYVAIFAFFIFNEKFNRYKILGISFGIVGTYFLTIGFNFHQLFYGPLVGDLLILLAGFIWAIYIIIVKKVLDNPDTSKNVSPLDLTNMVIIYTLIFGLIPLIFCIFYTPAIFLIPNNALCWIAIIYLGVTCTTLAYLVYNKGLQKLSPVVTAVISLTEVLVANILGIIFLPNQVYFTVDFMVGACFIVGAVIICSLK